MFNLSAVEVLVILVVALIVLGPERLPGAARKIGQMMGHVRDLSANFQREMHNAMTIPDVDAEKPHTRPHLTAIDGGRQDDERADSADAPSSEASLRPALDDEFPEGVATAGDEPAGAPPSRDTDSTDSAEPAAARTND